MPTISWTPFIPTDLIGILVHIHLPQIEANTQTDCLMKMASRMRYLSEIIWTSAFSEDLNRLLEMGASPNRWNRKT